MLGLPDFSQIAADLVANLKTTGVDIEDHEEQVLTVVLKTLASTITTALNQATADSQNVVAPVLTEIGKIRELIENGFTVTMEIRPAAPKGETSK